MIRPINRNLVCFTPKKTLIDWINSRDGPEEDILGTEDFFGHDGSITFLIPEFDSVDEALQWLQDDWKIWFDALMNDWVMEGDDYPLPPSWENLMLLLDIRYQSLILDSLPGPIRKSS